MVFPSLLRPLFVDQSLLIHDLDLDADNSGSAIVLSELLEMMMARFGSL